MLGIARRAGAGLLLALIVAGGLAGGSPLAAQAAGEWLPGEPSHESPVLGFEVDWTKTWTFGEENVTSDGGNDSPVDERGVECYCFPQVPRGYLGGEVVVDVGGNLLGPVVPNGTLSR